MNSISQLQAIIHLANRFVMVGSENYREIENLQLEMKDVLLNSECLIKRFIECEKDRGE